LDKRLRRQPDLLARAAWGRLRGEISKALPEILRDNLATQVIFKKAGFKLWATENDPSSVSPVLDL
jgi:hypothetical protein